MNEQHTPGRLYADKLQDRDACNVFVHGGTSALFTISPESKARRLAACWNACEPIADPENVVPRLLALNERVPELEHQAANLRTQCDELLAALTVVQAQCESMAVADWRKWEELASAEEFERWVKSRAAHMAVQARAAIAKLEGGAA